VGVFASLFCCCGQLQINNRRNWCILLTNVPLIDGNLHVDMNPWNYLENSPRCAQELDRLRYDQVRQFIFENNQPISVNGLGIPLLRFCPTYGKFSKIHLFGTLTIRLYLGIIWVNQYSAAFDFFLISESILLLFVTKSFVFLGVVLSVTEQEREPQKLSPLGLCNCVAWHSLVLSDAFLL